MNAEAASVGDELGWERGDSVGAWAVTSKRTRLFVGAVGSLVDIFFVVVRRFSLSISRTISRTIVMGTARGLGKGKEKRVIQQRIA